MKTVRIVVLVVILAATALFVAVSLGAEPADQSVQNYDSLVTAAISDYEANAANTENVNQQQVVAAWAAKDLLMVVGRQNAVIIDNQVEQYRAQDITQGLLRVLVLMTGLMIAAIAVIGLTQRDRGEPAGPAHLLRQVGDGSARSAAPFLSADLGGGAGDMVSCATCGRPYNRAKLAACPKCHSAST